jgi:Transposase DDE domain
MRRRRETVEHPFGTMKARMGATHFLTKTLPKVTAEMALSVLAYNLTRVMNIVGIKPRVAAIVAWDRTAPAFSRLPGNGVFTRPRPIAAIDHSIQDGSASVRLNRKSWIPGPFAH